MYPAAGEFYIYTVVLVSKLGAMGCAAGMGRREWVRLLGHCCHVMCHGIVTRGPQSDWFPAVATQKSGKIKHWGNEIFIKRDKR